MSCSVRQPNLALQDRRSDSFTKNYIREKQNNGRRFSNMFPTLCTKIKVWRVTYRWEKAGRHANRPNHPSQLSLAIHSWIRTMSRPTSDDCCHRWERNGEFCL